jgi:hypothetical protein
MQCEMRLIRALRAAWRAFREAWSTKPRHMPTCAGTGDAASCGCREATSATDVGFRR